MRSTLITTILLLAGSCFAQSGMDEIKMKSMIPFDPNGLPSADFKSFLNKELQGVSILALGECTHEDGLAFEYKTWLVKLLHENFGFNVIAFEFGFLGNNLNYENLKKGMEVKQATRYSGWSRSKYGFQVYEYINNTLTTASPLHYTGFDGEKVPNGIGNMKWLIDESLLLAKKQLSIQDSLALDSLIRSVYGPLGNPYKNSITFSCRKSSLEIIHNLIQFYEKEKSDLVERLGHQTYMINKLSLHSLLMDEKSTFAGAFWNIIRDKHMAERVKWIADSLYKGEKIILWGASAHFARNLVRIQRSLAPEDYGFYPYYQMGDWLCSFYGDKYYSIFFTAGSGKTGLVFPEGHPYKQYETITDIQPDQNSFEGAALQSASDLLFFSTRNSTLSENSFLAHPFGYNKDFAEWKQIGDAFFFIREMMPDVMIIR